MINPKFFGASPNKVTPENLGEAVQQAIEIEIATIPTYLFTYYSIVRSPAQQPMINMLTNALLSIGKDTPKYTFDQATEIALETSADIMVFANKTGALIMSVAIEEMLHLALASNLKQALAGMPILNGRSPARWPTYLPGHQPPLKINAAKLSLDQIKTFLEIEKPEKPKPKGKLLAGYIEFPTIGTFYAMVKECINQNPGLPYNTHSPQLVPGKGYYAQNNIDTIYYDKQHKPVFTNEDKGDLVYVLDKASALAAIDLIVEQGEGHILDAPYLQEPHDTINYDLLLAYDFKTKAGEEPSHFVKFAQIYQTFYAMEKKIEALGIEGVSFQDLFIMNIPENPLTADYPAHIAPVSDFINGVYTYIFVMIEECYRKAGNTQYETFMFGIHKSMIFILNSLCGDIMKLKYKDSKGVEYFASPTFENYVFSSIARPKAQLIDLYTAAVKVYPGISYLGQRVSDLPDVDL